MTSSDSIVYNPPASDFDTCFDVGIDSTRTFVERFLRVIPISSPGLTSLEDFAATPLTEISPASQNS